MLEVLATFTVTAGINYDYSMARGGPFIVKAEPFREPAPASG